MLFTLGESVLVVFVYGLTSRQRQADQGSDLIDIKCHKRTWYSDLLIKRCKVQ